MTNKFYKEHYKGVETVHEPRLLDREKMQKNIEQIRDAIKGKKRISFTFNGYNRYKKYIPIHKNVSVSPYYIVANGGHSHIPNFRGVKVNPKEKYFDTTGVEVVGATGVRVEDPLKW